MKIYLARHGQSRWQIERTNGDWNSPLTPLGHQQAQCLADWLANRPQIDLETRVEVGAIFSSPLQRAQETAVYSAGALQIPTTTDDNLAEATFLVSDHLPVLPAPIFRMAPFEPSADYGLLKDQARTALAALADAAESHGGAVLAFSHGGLISTLLRQAVGSDAVSFWLYNTSLNLIEWKRSRWHLVHLNLWDHLSPELRTV
ncbi:MAG: histidine phosphatase family protein [Ardenticatenaceae bacterium]|nr:histidine phosphatase family protein [Ardenticatenaceae bacterium]